MVLSRLLCICTFLSLQCSALEPDPAPSNGSSIAYLAKKGELESATQFLIDNFESQSQDLSTFRQLARAYLTRVLNSHKTQDQIFAFMGLALAGENATLLELLSPHLNGRDPQLSLAAVSLIAKVNNDSARKQLRLTQSSPFLPIRLEGAYHLALQQDPQAYNLIEALYIKSPEALHPLFPELYATLGTAPALAQLRRLLHSFDSQVRLQAIRSISQHKLLSLSPSLLSLSQQIDIPQREASASAIGDLELYAASDILESILHQHDSTVQIAAAYSLFRLGQFTFQSPIVKAAEHNNLFAFPLVAQLDQHRDILYMKLQSSSQLVRANAAIALLSSADKQSLGHILPLLCPETQHQVLLPSYSPGLSLSAWQWVPVTGSKYKKRQLLELGLRAREQLLLQCNNFSSCDFLTLARHLIDQRQNDLIPLLMQLLVSRENQSIIRLLEESSESLGAPLIRLYSRLALYQICPTAEHKQALTTFTRENCTNKLNIRPLTPDMSPLQDHHFSLSPRENSALWIDSVQALAQTRQLDTLQFFLQLLPLAAPRQQATLSGLIIQMSQ